MTQNATLQQTRDYELSAELVATAIRRARALAGITQTELSLRARLDAGQISRFESRKVAPNLETLARIAVAFGLDVVQLMMLAKFPQADFLEMAGIGLPIVPHFGFNNPENRKAIDKAITEIIHTSTKKGNRAQRRASKAKGAKNAKAIER